MKILDLLSKRELYILKEYPYKTIRKICDEMNISESRCFQIKERAITKLNRWLDSCRKEVLEYSRNNKIEHWYNDKAEYFYYETKEVRKKLANLLIS
jgi:hypothetical protein